MSRTTPLAISISPGDSKPIAVQIADAIRRQITLGMISTGDRLPSVRGLAQQLGINPNTVAKVYGQLTAEAWLEARAGLGLFVAAGRHQLSQAEQKLRLDDAVDRFIGEVVAIRCPADQALNAVADALDALATRKSA